MPIDARDTAAGFNVAVITRVDTAKLKNYPVARYKSALSTRNCLEAGSPEWLVCQLAHVLNVTMLERATLNRAQQLYSRHVVRAKIILH